MLPKSSPGASTVASSWTSRGSDPKSSLDISGCTGDGVSNVSGRDSWGVGNGPLRDALDGLGSGVINGGGFGGWFVDTGLTGYSELGGGLLDSVRLRKSLLLSLRIVSRFFEELLSFP